ncbi:MAG TPA: glycine cleavage system aminomethyltransferase GcvT [Gemmatimonadaceae bacterium]|nr:glycine cleavage system aminomethyltransferase GcvT [Gemmatimonadaceae bacterium]
MTSTSAALKRTEFFEIHKTLGAKIVPFAGYEMPVQYPTGITVEHKAVRTGCGLFDVSHMGEFIIRGEQAVDFVNRVTCNDVAALADGQAQYSGILTEQGTFVDDCLVYRYADHLMMVVNASNREKDYAHIEAQRTGFDAQLEDISDTVALLALQGPKAQEILAPLTSVELDHIDYYHFAVGVVAGIPDVTVSRTGYTGEDGFELYFAGSQARVMWDALTQEGNVTPAGLGARDTLRLEMGMALYGNDIDDTVTPLEANLAWIVKLAKGDFTGREALVKQKSLGVSRKLVGFTLAERAIARHGYPVFYEGAPSGVVTSGTMSPSVGVAIGMCYLPTAGTKEGTQFEVDIRGQKHKATVAKPPFYKNATHR